ncbi:MAG: hypothetical protein AAF125_14630, partial [Chloroflexota bacterium]
MTPWFHGETFERLVAFAISFVVLTTAGVAFLEYDASSKSNLAEVLAQRLIIENMGFSARGEVEVAYAQVDALRLWDVLDTRALVF